MFNFNDNFYPYNQKVYQAIARWLKIDIGNVSTKHCHDFAAFLNDPYDNKRHYVTDVSKPEIRHIIDMINGPYGHAVLKMLEIKHKEREHANNHQL